MPPDGFLLNTQLTHLVIPIKDGPLHLVKWIYMLDGGKVTCHALTDSPNNDPAILDVYVAPTPTTAKPLWPLSHWVHHALWGSAVGYAALLQAITDLEDPALYCEIEQYHALDAKIHVARIQCKENLANLKGLEETHRLCEE